MKEQGRQILKEQAFTSPLETLCIRLTNVPFVLQNKRQIYTTLSIYKVHCI